MGVTVYLDSSQNIITYWLYNNKINNFKDIECLLAN